MRLLLSEFIRTLKEREELDSILPQLLLSMKIVPLSKTQRGTRQFGVDLAAVGQDPEDQQKKIFLFVIKRGDIGRREWDSTPQSVRQSFNEIFDTYMSSCIPAQYKNLKKIIVLASSGDLKEEVAQNWKGFAEKYHNDAEFRFWGADEISLHMEKFFLNEYLFNESDRACLRQALALAGEVDHKPLSLFKLFRSQLELSIDGSIIDSNNTNMAKRILILNLSARLYEHWSILNENSKQPLIVFERALLWTWHRLRTTNCKSHSRVAKALQSIESDYIEAFKNFTLVIHDHCFVKDGIAGSVNDNVVLNLTLFETIGLLSAGGLFLLHRANSENEDREFARDVAQVLAALIQNNASASSPRLDEHVIEINLALMFLNACAQRDIAELWFEDLILRLCFSFSRRLYFPVNSLNELTSGEFPDLDADGGGFNYANSVMANLAYWCTYFGRADLYKILLVRSREDFPKLCMQLWYESEDVAHNLFFSQENHDRTGVSDAPIELPATIQEFHDRVEEVLKFDDVRVTKEREFAKGFNLIAYRHFRTLVPVQILHEYFHSPLQCLN